MYTRLGIWILEGCGCYSVSCCISLYIDIPKKSHFIMHCKKHIHPFRSPNETSSNWYTCRNFCIRKRIFIDISAVNNINML